MLAESSHTNFGQPPALITVTNVSYRYHGVESPALHNIHLDIAEGSCFGLLGPNGAGKTTLISLLTGVLTTQRGAISVAGQSIVEDAAAIKACSALVPQDYAFYPALSGRENLEFFAGLYRIPSREWASRLQYCVEVCGLQPVLKQRASNYSGGIKRRLNMAIGLLRQPRVLYLDEPTVGIDAQSRHFILSAIEQLKASGMTIVYTSHYMEEVERICDEVAIIDHGKVLLQQSMNELLQGDRHIYLTPSVIPSASLLESLRQLTGCEWDGEQLVLQSAGQALSELNTSRMGSIVATLAAQGIEIAKMQMGNNRLEQIYLSATLDELRG